MVLFTFEGMALEAFLAYLQLEKKYSPHTVKAYANDIGAFSAFCLDQFQLHTIDTVEYHLIRNWIVDQVGKGVSNRSVNRKIASLKAYYKFLLKIGAISNSPLAKHKALKTKKEVQLPFSEAEMMKINAELSFGVDFEGIRDKTIIELFYASGMRRAELMNLKLGDLDFSNSTIRVLGKRNKERVIPLISSLQATLDQYLNARSGLETIVDYEYLFLTKKGHKIYETLVYRVINKYFSMVTPKAKKSPHIIRHTFATHLLNKGADLNAVKELLGHSSLASTQIYTHNSIAELKKVHAAAHPRGEEN